MYAKNKIIGLFILPLLMAVAGCSVEDTETYYSIEEKRALLTEMAEKYGVTMCASDECLSKIQIDKSFIETSKEYCNDLRLMSHQKYVFVQVAPDVYESVTVSHSLTRAGGVDVYSFETDEIENNSGNCELKIKITASYERVTVQLSGNSSTTITQNETASISASVEKIKDDVRKTKPVIEYDKWSTDVISSHATVDRTSDSGIGGDYSVVVAIIFDGDQVFSDVVSGTFYADKPCNN